MSSGQSQFVLRLPTDLHAQLKSQAMAQGVSLNRFCLQGLSRYSLSPQHLDDNAALRKEIETGFPECLGVVLFGSVARGEESPNSDIDLLLVMKDGTSISRDLYSRWDRLFAQKAKLSPHFVLLPKHWSDGGSLWFEVALDGKIFWEKVGISHFLYEVRSAIAAGKIKRETSHGHPYWVRMESK